MSKNNNDWVKPDWSNKEERASVMDRNGFFEIDGSKREELTEIRTSTKVWLIENGKKIRQVHETSDKRDKLVLIDDGTVENYYQGLEKQARDYVNNTIIPTYEKKDDAFGDEELWRKMIYNAIKDQSLRFLGAILGELKIKSNMVTLEWCIDLAKYLMTELDGALIYNYDKDTEENKQVFKKMIKNEFAESELLKKLK